MVDCIAIEIYPNLEADQVFVESTTDFCLKELNTCRHLFNGSASLVAATEKQDAAEAQNILESALIENKEAVQKDDEAPSVPGKSPPVVRASKRIKEVYTSTSTRAETLNPSIPFRIREFFHRKKSNLRRWYLQQGGDSTSISNICLLCFIFFVSIAFAVGLAYFMVLLIITISKAGRKT